MGRKNGYNHHVGPSQGSPLMGYHLFPRMWNKANAVGKQDLLEALRVERWKLDDRILGVIVNDIASVERVGDQYLGCEILDFLLAYAPGRARFVINLLKRKIELALAPLPANNVRLRSARPSEELLETLLFVLSILERDWGKTQGIEGELWKISHLFVTTLANLESEEYRLALELIDQRCADDSALKVKLARQIGNFLLPQFFFVHITKNKKRRQFISLARRLGVNPKHFVLRMDASLEKVAVLQARFGEDETWLSRDDQLELIAKVYRDRSFSCKEVILLLHVVSVHYDCVGKGSFKRIVRKKIANEQLSPNDASVRLSSIQALRGDLERLGIASHGCVSFILSLEEDLVKVGHRGQRKILSSFFDGLV